MREQLTKEPRAWFWFSPKRNLMYQPFWQREPGIVRRFLNMLIGRYVIYW